MILDLELMELVSKDDISKISAATLKSPEVEPLVNREVTLSTLIPSPL